MPIEFSFRATGSRIPASGRHPIRQTDLATGKVAPFAEYLESHEMLAGFDNRTTLLTGYGTVALSLIVVKEVTGGAEPEFESGSFFTATSRPNPDGQTKADEHPETPDTDHVTDHVTDQVTDQVTGEVRLLHAIAGRTTRLQMQQAHGLIHNGHFRAMYLRLALEAGLVEMTVPDKPRNRNQRYHLIPTKYTSGV